MSIDDLMELQGLVEACMESRRRIGDLAVVLGTAQAIDCVDDWGEAYDLATEAVGRLLDQLDIRRRALEARALRAMEDGR